MTVDPDVLARLQTGFAHVFRDPDLLLEALTHRSYAGEHPGARANDGLALLGDAVLSLVVTEHLLRALPEAPVGVLTPRRAEIVSDVNLARWAERLGLGGGLRLGRGEQQSGGRAKESLLATALEAVVAVVYLESGLDGPRRLVAALAAW